VVLGWQWAEDILAFSSSVDESFGQSLHKSQTLYQVHDSHSKTP